MACVSLSHITGLAGGLLRPLPRRRELQLCKLRQLADQKPRPSGMGRWAKRRCLPWVSAERTPLRVNVVLRVFSGSCGLPSCHRSCGLSAAVYCTLCCCRTPILGACAAGIAPSNCPQSTPSLIFNNRARPQTVDSDNAEGMSHRCNLLPACTIAYNNAPIFGTCRHFVPAVLRC